MDKRACIGSRHCQYLDGEVKGYLRKYLEVYAM